MKHYKLVCTKRTDEDYCLGSIFIEIFAKGNNFNDAFADGAKRLYDTYGMNIDIFSNINMSFSWEDEDANA